LRFLLLAGERALDLDVSASLGLLERALELAPAGHPDRPMVLRLYGLAMNSSARSRDAIVALEEALTGFRAAGDVLATADVIGTLSSTFRDIGDARGWTYPHEVVDLLEGLGPSWVLADALIRLGFVLSAEGRLEESLATLVRAETVAAEIADPLASDAMAFRGNLLGVRGLVGAMLGDERGLEEMEEAVGLSIASGNSNRAGHTSSNLGQQVSMWRGPRSGVEVLQKGLEFAAGRGLQAHVVYHRLCELFCAFDLGEHDAVLDGVPALEQALESYGWASALVWLRSFGVGIATLRGKPVDAATLGWIEEGARESTEPDDLLGLAATVPAHLLRGERDAARTLLIELGPHIAAPYAWWWQAWEIASLVRASLELDELGLAESMVGGFHTRNPYAQHAAVTAKASILEARGDLAAAAAAYGDAADRWARFEVIPELAFAMLGQGRSLVASGRADEAAKPLARARSIFEGLKAAPALAEIAELSNAIAPTGT
jgi:tetratricopeptide (TPR) repeat protein